MKKYIELLTKRLELIQEILEISRRMPLLDPADNFDQINACIAERQGIIGQLKKYDQQLSAFNKIWRQKEQTHNQSAKKMIVGLSEKIKQSLAEISDIDTEISIVMCARRDLLKSKLKEIQKGKKMLRGYHSNKKNAYFVQRSI